MIVKSVPLLLTANQKRQNVTYFEDGFSWFSVIYRTKYRLTAKRLRLKYNGLIDGSPYQTKIKTHPRCGREIDEVRILSCWQNFLLYVIRYPGIIPNFQWEKMADKKGILFQNSTICGNKGIFFGNGVIPFSEALSKHRRISGVGC